MAHLYRAQVDPTKLELVTAWLPTRPWYDGPAVDLARVDSFRFDDPAGRVGIETMLVAAGDGPLLQVPLTYREAPLDGHEQWLVGTTEHSVLGPRWVYDGCGDPVYVSALATTILTGAAQADEMVDYDGRLVRREPTASIRGTGSSGGAITPITTVLRVDEGDPTVIHTEPVELTIVRILDDPEPAAGTASTLAGTWSGQRTSVVLARARVV